MLLALAGPAGAVGLSSPAAALVRAPLPTIVQDDALLVHGSDAEVATSLDELASLGIHDVRATAQWNQLAPDAQAEVPPPGFDPSDPAAYEQARFAPLDRLVRLAAQRGIAVLLDVGFYAPRWASTDAPAETRPRQAIDPPSFAAFAAALARRYDGTFDGLPRVARFSLWNEPNHTSFLVPQWKRVGGHFVPASPGQYRRMVRAAYPAVKAAQPGATVLVGGTSSTGSYRRRGTGPVPPLAFLRALACVDRNLRPVSSAGCRNFQPVPGDGWTHHPYSLQTVPDAPIDPAKPDDVPLGNLGRLTSTLDRLVAMGRLAPGLRRVFITEYGYESNPPSRLEPWSMGDQARFLAWSEYLAWRNPAVGSFAQFLVRDTPPAPTPVSTSVRRPYGNWGSGLFFADGAPKLARVAFGAGLYVRHAARGQVLIWGHLRDDLGAGARQVRIEQRRAHGAPWVALESRATGRTARSVAFATTPDGIFQRVAAGVPGGRYRIRYGAAFAEASMSFGAQNRPVAARSHAPAARR